MWQDWAKTELVEQSLKKPTFKVSRILFLKCKKRGFTCNNFWACTHFEKVNFKISRIPFLMPENGAVLFCFFHCTNSWILWFCGILYSYYDSHTTSTHFGKFKIKISRIQLFEARKGRCAFLLWVIAQIRFVNCLLPEREVKTSQKDYPSRKIFPWSWHPNFSYHLLQSPQ